ncbi:MAG: FG-GAP repeat domain-containing protein [Phycisphaerae bacterium]
MRILVSIVGVVSIAWLVGCETPGRSQNGGGPTPPVVEPAPQPSPPTPQPQHPATQPTPPKPAPQPKPEPEPPAPSPTEPAPVSFTERFDGLPDFGNWKCDPVFADVNNDGNLDLLGTPRLGESTSVWLGDGKGHWKASSDGLKRQAAPCGGGVAVGDVNNDGKLDLAVADHCHGVHVYLGDGTGKWRATTEELFPADVAAKGSLDEYKGAESLALGDVNEDGNLDIVASGADEGGGVQLYLGDGAGRTWRRVPDSNLPERGWANRTRLLDMNGDQHLDVVVTLHEGVRVFHGDGQGKFTRASQGLPSPLTLGIYCGLDIGDVNGDGRPDLAVANWVDGPEVYLQNEDHSWQKVPDVFPAMRGGAFGIALGDVDGDGKLDLVTSGRMSGQETGHVYGIFLLLGDGTGTFRNVATTLPTTGLAFTWGVTLTDWNKDGVPDLAAASGGLVATDPKRTRPVLPARMLAWSLSRNSR